MKTCDSSSPSVITMFLCGLRESKRVKEDILLFVKTKTYVFSLTKSPRACYI
jgi:hypothetical protein